MKYAIVCVSKYDGQFFIHAAFSYKEAAERYATMRVSEKCNCGACYGTYGYSWFYLVMPMSDDGVIEIPWYTYE